MMTRRQLLQIMSISPLVAAVPGLAFSKAQDMPKILRNIPSSGEAIPVVGMGSSQTFNVRSDSETKAELLEVLKAFFDGGGSLIDSSPMYNRSEAVLGELMAQIEPFPRVFAASKVWTNGEDEGIKAIEESRQRMKVAKMDLMQVHNLKDWKVHLKTLNRMKQEGQIRYTGITTSRLSQYQEFESVMQAEKLDFIQLNYNIKVREAEKRLLPLAQDKGIAVIVNKPYEKGRLFKLVRGLALPEWAQEFDCQSWGQFFLKFILSHPAVTCAIPATSKIHHMHDNMQAMYGRLPDEKTRNKMVSFLESI